MSAPDWKAVAYALDEAMGVLDAQGFVERSPGCEFVAQGGDPCPTDDPECDVCIVAGALILFERAEAAQIEADGG